MGLDIRTLMMLAAAITLLMGLSLRYVLREHPAELYPSIRLWTLGLLLQPVAWLLFGLRDQIPDAFSVVLANTLLSFAFAKQIQALRVFVGLRVNKLVLYLPVFAVLFDELVFTYVMPSMRLRLLTATPLFCIQMAYGGALLLSGRHAPRRSHRLTAAAFLTLAAVLMVRVVFEAMQQTFATALSTSPMQTLVFAFASFYPTLSTLGFVLMCSDSLNLELERQATIDSLTGVSNRQTLTARASQAIALARRHERPLALLLIDIDHFKRVNDTYGHQTGDDALKWVAATLLSELRGEDLLGRVGGEEFVIVLPESTQAAAAATAERLRGAVEKIVFVPRGETCPLRVSVGYAMLGANDDFTTLLRRADEAMYTAKREGRNCVRGPASGMPVAAAAAQ